MLRTIKPRNARSKRALDKREPKAIENPKTTLFLRGTSASEIVQSAMNDIHALKNPLVKKFTKKNAVYPFEDASPLEFFSTKNDTSLLLLASHSKKRPHNLIFMRTFDHRMLDIVELGLDPETFLPLTAFKNSKPAIGLKPMIAFQGAVWDSDPRFKHLRSIFLDFFRGPTVPQVDVEGLQYVLTFSATEVNQDEMTPVTPKIHFRGYLIKTKKSGQKLPRVEVEEMGPRMDFTLRRVQEPDAELLKEAMKQAKKLEPRTKKNIEMDIIGDKLGRIHTGKQQIEKMQSRKMKGLKRSNMDDEPDTPAAAPTDEERPKRTRTA